MRIRHLTENVVLHIVDEIVADVLLCHSLDLARRRRRVIHRLVVASEKQTLVPNERIVVTIQIAAA